MPTEGFGLHSFLEELRSDKSTNDAHAKPRADEKFAIGRSRIVDEVIEVSASRSVHSSSRFKIKISIEVRTASKYKLTQVHHTRMFNNNTVTVTSEPATRRTCEEEEYLMFLALVRLVTLVKNQK